MTSMMTPRPSTPIVVRLTSAAIREEVEAAARDAGLSHEEFVRRAESHDLNDDRLRDLWMMSRPALV